MFNQERISPLIRFCAVGGSVAVIDLTVVWITSHLLPSLVAVTLGYVTGVTCHFLLNKFWVFKCNSQQYGRQLGLYLVHLVLYWLMTMLLVSLVLSLTEANVIIARVISIPPMSLFTFCFLRFVIFNQAKSELGLLHPEVRARLTEGRRVTTGDLKAYTLGTDFEPNG